MMPLQRGGAFFYTQKSKHATITKVSNLVSFTVKAERRWGVILNDGLRIYETTNA